MSPLPTQALRRIARGEAPLSLWPLALVCAVATIWGLVHVSVRLQLISVGYEISRQTQLQHDLTELTQRLSLELRTRMDLGTVEKLARERLGMVPIDPQRVRSLALPAQNEAH
jgi:cell division protein FtsL